MIKHDAYTQQYPQKNPENKSIKGLPSPYIYLLVRICQIDNAAINRLERTQTRM